MKNTYAKEKAALITVLLVALGIFNVQKASDWTQIAPLIIFYALLSVNTFFSVRHFSSFIPPDDKRQWVIDAILVIFYIILAFNIDNPMRFALWAALLFSVSVVKYIELLWVGDFLDLLKYKIFIDSIGTISCVGALGGIISGYAMISIWIWAIVFAIANAYIFFMNPLYSFPKK